MKQTLTTLAIAALFFAACTQNNSNTNSSDASLISEATESIQQIESVLPSIAKEPAVFKINVAEAQELTTETGSTISIPANAFTDAEGNPITGEVEISFEEFHDASDVILSGIPMNYETEEGKMEFFETAGMFNIKGSQNGKDIHIAKDKAIDIELATFKPEEDFNFYEFEEEKGEWVEKAPAEDIEVRRNRVREALAKVVPPAPTKPVNIKKAKSSDFVFELAVDKDQNPEFEAFDNVLWRTKDKDPRSGELFKSRVRNPELACIDEAKSTYRLTGFAGGNKIETTVEPVLFGSNYKKAQASFNSKLKDYNNRIEERKSKMDRVNKMAELTRELQVQNFGVFNCDRTSIWRGKKKISLHAIYFLPALSKTIEQAVLIIKRKGKNIAIPLNKGYSTFFTFSPEDENTLISFDNQGNLYEFTNDRFGGVRKMDGKYTFELKKTPYKVTSKRDLDDYMDQL